jgi:hypothetical protein
MIPEERKVSLLLTWLRSHELGLSMHFWKVS